MTIHRSQQRLVWDSLIAETQFATELCTSGLRHLCAVPLPADMLFPGTEDDLKHVLHVGLHGFTSGLERLGKIALLIAGRLEFGRFQSVRGYSHKIVDLYNSVLAIPGRLGTSIPSLGVSDPVSETPRLSAALDILTEFASGAGRYTYLDTLANGVRTSDPYAAWIKFCATVPPLSDRATRLLWAYNRMPDAIYAAKDDFVEPVLQPVFDARAVIRFTAAAAVLDIYRLVVPVANTVSELSSHAFYSARVPEIPLLSEVTGRHFAADPEDFLSWELLQLGDDDVLIEALLEIPEDDGWNEGENDETCDDGESPDVGTASQQ